MMAPKMVQTEVKKTGAVPNLWPLFLLTRKSRFAKYITA
jgi:hypothetical protein